MFGTGTYKNGNKKPYHHIDVFINQLDVCSEFKCFGKRHNKEKILNYLIRDYGNA